MLGTVNYTTSQGREQHLFDFTQGRRILESSSKAVPQINIPDNFNKTNMLKDTHTN